jgi:autotransporter passenger strand-loop-strand repeat protein
VPAGNVVEVFAGGLASGVIIGGKGIVFSGGTDISATVSSGGTEIVSSGGTVIDPTVLASGTLIVSSGGALDVHGIGAAAWLLRRRLE